MGPGDRRGQGSFEVVIRVRDLERARTLYRRLGFVEVDVDEGRACRLRCGDSVLVLRDRAWAGSPERDELTTHGPRGGGVVLSVAVRDVDEVLAYWLEEGMLIVAGPQRSRGGRVFHGLDHDGYELRVQGPDVGQA